MLRLKHILTALFLVSFGVLGCDKFLPTKPKPKPPIASSTAAQPPVVKGTVIAKVNNFAITLEDLNEEIASYNSMVPEDKPELKITARQGKIDYLRNQMVRKMFLYQEALDRGLDKKEEVIAALEKTKQDLLVLELVRQEAEKAEVSSKEIEEYYERYKEELKEPEERRIREIGVVTEQEARDVLIQLLQGADFEALAKEKSKLKSASSGGDLGFMVRKKRSAQFDDAAFASTLETGKTSNIFKDTDGYYYILKLETKRGGKEKALTAMWDDIKRGLTYLKQQQRIDDLVAKLARDAKIEISDAEIK